MSRPEREIVLEANLAALSLRNAPLAVAIRSSAPNPDLLFLEAKTGALVPAVRMANGKAPLHSLYDPMGESRKQMAGLQGTGCIVIFGMGAGFLVAASLENAGVSSVLVIEKDASTLRALLERHEIAPLLRDPRVFFSVGLGGIRAALLSAWQPALMGAMRTVPLRPWCEREQGFFMAATAQLQVVVDEIRADYSVQAHFGKRWFANMLLNMAPAEKPSQYVPHCQRAHVIAAGPSLEKQFAALAAAGDTDLLLASDTSLPALLRAGIQPGGVVSIDCQNHGYHHFLQGIPEHTTLFLDLASPPLLARMAARVSFVASDHPFALYLDARWKRFVKIDTSGGNVTHAAVSLASRLGAGTITLYGADFSYPDGKPYSRGTYIYDLFDSGQSRLLPTESRVFSFIFRSPDTRKEQVGTTFRYTTDVMLAYRARLLRLIQRIRSEVIAVQGGGMSLDQAVVKERSESHADDEIGWRRSHARCGWRQFLAGYVQDLAALDPLGEPAGSSFRSLGEAERELWATLLPISARVIMESTGEAPGASALDSARRWAISRISRVIDTAEPSRQA